MAVKAEGKVSASSFSAIPGEDVNQYLISTTLFWAAKHSYLVVFIASATES